MTVSYVLNAVLTLLLALILYQYVNLKNQVNLTEDLDKERSMSSETTGKANLPVQTSVFCHGDEMEGRICHFRNICFHGKETQFMFFVGPESVVGDADKLFSEDHHLSLSSVMDLNGLNMPISHLPSDASSDFDIMWISEKSFVFSRFKPDNLMHVFHDDVLPLHSTLNFLMKGTLNSKLGYFPVQLIFMDNFDQHKFDTLYQTMSKYILIYKSNLTTSESKKITCFSDLYAGLFRSTIWYQYGYKVPQGPVQNLQVKSDWIRNTAHFIARNMKCSNPYDIMDSEYLVLFSRKENRLILNENELMVELMKNSNMKIWSVSLEDYSLFQLILIVQKSKGLIGMHGSSLILSLFLPPNSILIELFPYAVNPSNYTPFKTLCGINHMGIVYRSWQNLDKEKSKGYPERDRMLGGLTHLNFELQKQIIDQSEVPLHLCCDDPSWLYHIYQDTTVDISEVSKLCDEALKEADLLKIKPPALNLIPSAVKNLECSVSDCVGDTTAINLAWKTPLYLEYLSFEKFHYYVIVQEMETKKNVAYIVNRENYTISEDIFCDRSYNVWVRLILDDTRQGSFQHVMCVT
ncbi:hypothetical protein FSP39_023764 [Pinctada imbricata]|uniref:Glycosyltransferase 61 catalytic domain-containing protein n=1 Tax=Pinctada imbricata TaxID=66713 RepID=A0AA89BTJ9_PINIB|nr:hypothetical protein FSP39_023764 [Pinctada imbricata]